MKPECNVNQRELGSIVRDMLAEKNKTGRAAFDVMRNEEIDEVSENSSNLESVLKLAENNGARELIISTVDSRELTISEIWYDSGANAIRISVG